MKRRLVSNTGPLVALALVERLDVLESLFETTTIPEAVHEEILQGGAIDAGVNAYRRAAWIRVEPLQASLDPLLTLVLDRGEASVIQLAREQAADCVLIDERKARKIARTAYGLKVIGSAGVLVEAKKQGILTSVGEALTQMREKGYWIHDRIVTAALEQAGET
jgi:hypothetical protein